VIAAIIYANNGKGFMAGEADQILPNLLAYSNLGMSIRRVDGTPLSDMATYLDERTPSTAEEFDLLYPEAPHWSAVETAL
jgi:hypothetical protein